MDRKYEIKLQIDCFEEINQATREDKEKDQLEPVWTQMSVADKHQRYNKLS